MILPMILPEGDKKILKKSRDDANLAEAVQY